MRRYTRCVAAACVVLFGLAGVVMPAAAQAPQSVVPVPVAEKLDAKKPAAAEPLAGVVVDMAGKPVAGATVGAIRHHDSGETVAVAETTSDENGKFRIANAEPGGPSNHPRPPTLTARDSQGRIGGQVRSYQEFEPSAAPSANANREIRIVLHDVKDYRGRLLDAAGQPIAKATIRVKSCWNVPAPTGYSGSSLTLPPKLKEEMATESGVDGSFTIRGLPTRGWARVPVRAEGFGKPEVRLNLEKSATVRLGRSGAIRGTATCRENPKAATGVAITLNGSEVLRSASARTQDGPAYEVFYAESIVTCDDGTFQIEGVPAGKYTVKPSISSQLTFDARPIYAENAPQVEVKPGETATASLRFGQAVKLQGRVVDQQTGEGIANVLIFLMPTSGHRLPFFPAAQPVRNRDGTTSYQTPRSGSDGRFSFYVPLGKATIQYQFGLALGGYRIAPGSQMRRVEVEIKGDTTLEPLRLPRTKLSALEGVAVEKSVAPVAGAKKTSEKKPSSVGPFEGTVVDVAQKPVAGAAVWLIGGNEDDPQIVAKTTSDKKGQFHIAKQAWKMSASSARAIPTMLAARDSGGRIGGSVYYVNPQLPNNIAPREFRIKLHDVRDCHGRLTDPSGQPIAGVKIRPTMWSCDWNAEERVQHLIFLPTLLAKEMATETGADGRFTLRGLPTIGRITANVSADGCGKPIAVWKLESPVSLQIGRVGSVRGSVVCRHDPKVVAGIKLRLRTCFPPRGIADDVFLRYAADGVTANDGSFQFTDVPPGMYTALPELPNTSPYYSEDTGPVVVKSGEIASVPIPLKRAVRLQGKIIDGETGTGVAGVRVMLYLNDPLHRGDDAKPTTTNAQGAFTIYSRPGTGFLQIWDLPDQYVNSFSGAERKEIEVKNDTTLEPFHLERAKLIEDTVVDKSGKPVAGAKIVCTSVNMNDNFFPDRELRTDRNGKFSIKRVTPKMRLNIRARTDHAAAEPVSVVVGASKDPLRLVLNESTSCTAKGLVVDDDGKPLPNAKIELIINLRFGDHGTSFGCETVASDAKGEFQIGGLWAGDGYELRVSASDFETRGTRQITGVAGGTIDFGKIVLLSTSGVVEGKVVDSSGKPLAGVRVLNSGDAPQPLQTSSDEDGKFRLTGFRKGTVYVCAEKGGYRFTSLKTASGAADAVLGMLRNDEPPPKWSPPSPPTNEAEQKFAATRKVIELLLTAKDEYIKGRAREQLAALDATQKATSERHRPAAKPSSHAQPKRNDIYGVAEEDVDEALSMLPQDQNQAYQQLKGLAEHFAASDREKALRFVSEAIVRSRNLDDPVRLFALADLGTLASRLGNKQAGAKLVREAADVAGKWALNEQREWQLAELAKKIARVDLPVALQIAKKIGKQRRSNCLANIAMELDDASEVESILKDCDGWYAGRARGRVALRIAANRPADAIKLIEGMPSDYGRGDLTKAAAFGWLAAVIAQKDPKLAHGLIDRGFAAYLRPSDPTQYMAGERAALPALLAVHAQIAGYPDMESVISRVLATRVTMKNSWSPVAVQESSVASAMFLALVDRRLAKEMLQAVEPNSDAIGSGCCGIGIREWLKAWALVDPQHAAELIERHAAAAKDENEKRSAWYAAQEVIELWSSDRNEILKRLVRDYSNIFSPYER